MRKSTVIKIIIAVITLCILATSAVVISRYNNAAETAENTVAVYLAKNYNTRDILNKYDSKGGFNRFNDFYSTTKIDGVNCIVESGGSISSGYQKGTLTFYSRVKINLFTNHTKIETIKIENRNYLK